jgi:ArsR family transcriptional regulator, zinc-responsive transcriptional repressor
MKAVDSTKLIDLPRLQEAAECLRTLAHPVRLRMVQSMLQGEHTVGELAQACGIPSHMASEHLRMMQHCGFLSRRPEGRRIYYQVVEPALERLMACIESRFGGECTQAAASPGLQDEANASHS